MLSMFSFLRRKPAPPPEALDERIAPRDRICIPVTVDSGSEWHDAVILDLNLRGARIYIEDDAPRLRPCIGQLIAVRPSGGVPIAAQVRWFEGRHLGVQFLVNMHAETLSMFRSASQHRLQPRPSRARVGLDVEIVAGPNRQKARLTDISSGGARITCTDCPEAGTPVMLHLEGLMPIAGHVRWSDGEEAGVMFTRLLPVGSARYIAEQGMVSRLWLQEVIEQHETATPLN